MTKASCPVKHYYYYYYFFLQFLLVFGKVAALKPAWVGYGEKENEFSYGSLQDQHYTLKNVMCPCDTGDESSLITGSLHIT